MAGTTGKKSEGDYGAGEGAGDFGFEILGLFGSIADRSKTTGEMAMVVYECDLCGEVKECLQKEIDHKEYDICRECWGELQAKLQGKGRVKESREIILLSPPREPDEREEKPEPGEPPIIRGSSERPN
jgi:hypothetical protein